MSVLQDSLVQLGTPVLRLCKGSETLMSMIVLQSFANACSSTFLLEHIVRKRMIIVAAASHCVWCRARMNARRAA